MDNNKEIIIVHTYKNRLSLRNRMARAIWNVVYVIFFRPFVGKVFNRWRLFLLRLFGAKIGRKCSVSASVKVWAPWNLVMNEYTLLAAKVTCYNPALITLHSETIVSDGVYLCTASHNIHSKKHELITAPITLQGQVWVAMNAFILPGVTIGTGAVVGACAVVTKDVAPWTVTGGNPARLIGKRVISPNEEVANEVVE